MPSDNVEIALRNFCGWMAERQSHKKVAAVSTPADRVLGYCLFLIYYFSLCDFILKWLPVPIAIPLRYLPEAALYIIALRQMGKGRRFIDFPLLWPLCACAVGMVISAVLNSVSIIAAVGDFRFFYRFAAFTFIAWKMDVRPHAIARIMKGFLGLTAIQLGVGTLEVLGGAGVQQFFAPLGGWFTGNAGGASNQTFGESGWIFGTLSNYNTFGMFMTMSCVMALGVYCLTRKRAYMAMAITCGIFVVLSFSRHSLLDLAGATLCFYALRSRANVVKKVFQGVVVAVVLSVVIIEAARVSNPALESRLATFVNPRVMSTDSVANIRFFILAALPPRFLTSYPLFGQGPLNTAPNTYGDERDIFMAPPLKGAPELPGIFTHFLGDVVWVLILGLYGLVGLGGFIYILWRIAKSANRIRKEDSNPGRIVLAQVCLSVMVAFIISGFFSQEMIARDCIPIFWLLAGMTLSSASALAAEIGGVSPRRV